VQRWLWVDSVDRRSSAGKLFQVSGPETAKFLRPMAVAVCCTSSLLEVSNCRCRRPVRWTTGRQSSAKYGGAKWVRCIKCSTAHVVAGTALPWMWSIWHQVLVSLFPFVFLLSLFTFYCCPVRWRFSQFINTDHQTDVVAWTVLPVTFYPCNACLSTTCASEQSSFPVLFRCQTSAQQNDIMLDTFRQNAHMQPHSIK